MLSIYELPESVESASVLPFFQQITSRSVAGFGSECPLVQLLLDDDLFTIALSTFDTEHWRRRGAHAVGGRYPIRVPWEVWGPRSLHPSESEWTEEIVAVSGLRIIYRSFILDFNPLDATRNIYGSKDATLHGEQPSQQQSAVQSGIVGQVASTYRFRSTSYSRPEGPIYRQTSLTREQLSPDEHDMGIYFIEDMDGPKV